MNDFLPASKVVADFVHDRTATHPLTHGKSDPIDALNALHELRGEVEDAIAGWVAAARANGETWQQIALVLRVTKQAAWERFGKPDA